MSKSKFDQTREKIGRHIQHQKKALREEAARGLAGLWASHSDEQSVEETVRMMRRGRQFDS